MKPDFRWCWCFLAVLTLASSVNGQSEPQAIDRSTAAERLAQELPRIAATHPEQALETFHLQGGFRLELLAAEPLVTDPVAVKYDENGLAYVAEMGDYPYSDKSHDHPYAEQTSLPLGRVRVLEDTDGDGRFDKSTVLADHLSWPTGLALWKGGVFVTSTPDIIYLKDTDGDRKADIHRTVFTGFRKFNVQSVINNLQWGLDHRIYGAGSSNGGEIRRIANRTAPPITMRRSDFRFNPPNESFELVTGGARFGNTFDDWGNRFLCDIRNPVQHVVLDNRYLSRNPLLSVRSGLHDCGKSGGEVQIFRASPPEPWRVINSQRLASNPDSTSPNSEKVAAGFLTSSSGITVYRGAAYPPEYAGNIFVGDVAGNVTLRYTLQPRGPTFQATRDYGRYEFIASTDNWFRPVNFTNAPDGTLHVVDMYRETIEHPWSIPADIKAHLDLVSGRDRGRIYRLVPPAYREGFEPPQPPRLGEVTTEELVSELENPNAWWRETAHRLLYERQDQSAVNALQKMLRSSRHATGRLHALWSLVGLDALQAADVEAASTDSSPHLRRAAIRLGERFLPSSPHLVGAVLRASRDRDVRVRFQAAFTLGELPSGDSLAALSRLARQDGHDPWVRTAVLSSLAGNTSRFLIESLADHDFAISDTGQAFIAPLAVATGFGHQSEILKVLESVATYDTRPTAELEQLQRSVLMGVGRGMRDSGKNLMSLTSGSSPSVRRMLTELQTKARQQALDDDQDTSERLKAIALLGYTDFATSRETLVPLLDPRQPQQIQSAAIGAIAGFRHSQVADALLHSYAQLTPTVRKEVVQALLARYDRLPKLVEAVARKEVSATLISSSQRRRILAADNEAMVELATKIFVSDAASPRSTVIRQYRDALSLPADLKNGESVFRRECMNCHRLGGQGHDVGPDLATVRHRSASDVLVQILDPHRDVSPNYHEYVVVTHDGRVHNGTIAAETATGVTLRAAENKEQVILRTSIDTIRSTGKSLMPDGLEQKITPQQMADLLAYILRATPQPQSR